MFRPSRRLGAPRASSCILFFFNDTATTEIYTLSLHDALPIFTRELHGDVTGQRAAGEFATDRGEFNLLGREADRRGDATNEHRVADGNGFDSGPAGTAEFVTDHAEATRQTNLVDAQHFLVPGDHDDLAFVQ